MVKYQLRLSTRNRDGHWDHRYTGLYATVAEIFAKPEFAAYVQKNMLGEYHTIKVFAVNVADENVQIGCWVMPPNVQTKGNSFSYIINLK